jgi:hypothetical protein
MGFKADSVRFSEARVPRKAANGGDASQSLRELHEPGVRRRSSASPIGTRSTPARSTILGSRPSPFRRRPPPGDHPAGFKVFDRMPG